MRGKPCSPTSPTAARPMPSSWRLRLPTAVGSPTGMAWLGLWGWPGAVSERSAEGQGRGQESRLGGPSLSGKNRDLHLPIRACTVIPMADHAHFARHRKVRNIALLAIGLALPGIAFAAHVKG